MEVDGGVSVLIIVLGGLIGLSVLFWALRLVWAIVQSPVALAILLSLLALALSATALQMAKLTRVRTFPKAELRVAGVQ